MKYIVETAGAIPCEEAIFEKVNCQIVLNAHIEEIADRFNLRLEGYTNFIDNCGNKMCKKTYQEERHVVNFETLEDFEKFVKKYGGVRVIDGAYPDNLVIELF